MTARVGELEQDPNWVNRVRLRAPRTGDLTRGIAELEGFRTPLTDFNSSLESHLRFQRLMESGYGTPAYKTRFWRLSYYRDWKAGDALVDQTKLADFAAVRAEYEKNKNTIAVFDDKLGALRGEVAAGEAVEKEHADLTAGLEHLEDTHLALWRGHLSEHLRTLDPAALGDRVQGEPDIELMLKQGAGLGKKIDYLDAIVAQQVQPYARLLRDEDSALDRDIGKFSRPKKAYQQFDESKFDKRFRERPDKLRRQWTRTRESYQTVYVFDRYDRYRWVDDMLWWDLMTSGRYDGRFIPEVHYYYSAHPGYVFDRHAWDADDVAAAAAAAAVIEADQAGVAAADVAHDVS
jgi:hypothetical protein